MTTQIGFVCFNCNSTILRNVNEIEICEDEDIILENEKVKLHRFEFERNLKLQEVEIKDFTKSLRKLIDIKEKSRFNRTKYDFFSSDWGVNVYTKKGCYVLTDDEAEMFVSITGLYTKRNKDGKLYACFEVSDDMGVEREERYLLCPLCNHKNFLPVKSLILR